MKILYLDLGLYKATELRWMVEEILPDCNITDYKAYGFEPCRSHAINIQEYFREDSRVVIDRIAIGGFDGPGKLYHAKNRLGHSIFSSKNNVDRRDFEVILVRKFSSWVARNNIDLKSAFVILKVNIEGAEYDLFRDLVESGLIKDIDIVCGAIDDVKKIKGYTPEQVEDYYQLLSSNNISCIPFTEYRPETIENIRQIVKSL